MSEDPKPLPDDLARFVRAERAASDVPAGAEARVMARLMTSLGTTGPGGHGGGASPAPTHGAAASVARVTAWSPALLAGVFLSGVVTGVLGTRLATGSSTEDHRALAPAPVVSSATLPAEHSEDSPRPPIAVPTYASPSLLPSVPGSAAPSAQPSRARQLAEEQAILDVARAAMNRREGASALDAVERHERRYPSGLLTEEREALGIQAMLLLSRANEARTRATRFEQRYPRSVLLPTVQAAVEAHD